MLVLMLPGGFLGSRLSVKSNQMRIDTTRQVDPKKKREDDIKN